MKRLLLVLALALSLTACNDEPTAKATQSAKAQEAANSISFTENAEIDNIKRRLELTSSPALAGYVLLLNEMGQPIMYSTVKGKITSGAKRLTAPDRYSAQGTNGFIRSAPSDEGTYGTSGEYIFFWNAQDQYVQWNGKYLYSDKPIRVKIEPLVISN